MKFGSFTPETLLIGCINIFCVKFSLQMNTLLRDISETIDLLKHESKLLVFLPLQRHVTDVLSEELFVHIE